MDDITVNFWAENFIHEKSLSGLHYEGYLTSFACHPPDAMFHHQSSLHFTHFYSSFGSIAWWWVLMSTKVSTS